MPVLVEFTPLTTFSVPFVAISSSGTPTINKLDLLCLSSPDSPFTTCSVIIKMDLINISFVGWHNDSRRHWKDTEEKRGFSSRFVCSSRQTPTAQKASAASWPRSTHSFWAAGIKSSQTPEAHGTSPWETSLESSLPVQQLLVHNSTASVNFPFQWTTAHPPHKIWISDLGEREGSFPELR